ncbi:sensor histidine kinase [Aridibaculum aurantiacum]|uniref:sensor histidine kinase n=1 Tax=Aridibaculum aurantiacum TaxID=2810307 RepID=UPI001A974622|nr:histidine kinase [Aridibaculum aurantiacum]
MNISLPYRSVSTIKPTLIVVIGVSIVFPLLFAYINDEMTREVLVRELVLTPLRLVGVAIVVFAVVELFNHLVKKTRVQWWRYLLEFPVIAVVVYQWLIWTLVHVEGPIRCGNCPFEIANINPWNFRQYISLYMVGTLFTYIFQSGVNIYQQAQQKAAEAEKYEKDCAVVCLQALRNQVNPHFLFNSLSVLSSLVHVSPETSEKFIHQLSKAYRYILDQKDLEWVTLKAELDFLDAYFFLLQIRFDKKVRLEKQVDIDQHIYTLPPLTLQLLVENVVKHNKMSVHEPLVIKVYNEGEQLVVQNNISRRDQHESSTGIGLANIRQRYEYITDQKIQIEDNETDFTVRLPLIQLKPSSI